MNFSKDLQGLDILKTVQEAADSMDIPSYLVGGWVRDLVLGKKAGKDLDIVCVGDGIELARQVSSILPKTPKVVVFKNFGTAMLQHQGYELEFVGARKESYSRHSRKPNVEQGTLSDDQKRRDFTINAMAISLKASEFGELLDPFQGVEDLRKKIIRTPLDPLVTFSDDPLRMMRAVRFASQLNFDIEAGTFEAIREQSNRLKIVSVERITEELNKIILTPKPSYGFKLLHHADLLQFVLPSLVKLQGVETREGKGHKDNFYHTLQVLDNIAEHSDDLWLRWAALLHDIAKPATKRYHPKVGWTFHGHEDKGAQMVPKVFRSLRLPLNDKMKYVQKLVRLHLRPISLVKDHVTDSAIRRLIYDSGEHLEDLMTLCRADITSKNHSKVKKYLSNFDKVEKRVQQVEARDEIRNFQPVITGEIIMRTFNLPPSKMVGQIKEELKEAVLDGEVKNELGPARQYMIKIARDKGLEPVSQDVD
ncbi:MAG: CCA tRNA nucleotidyltransferase [Cyclobacteriaceae bacterium]|nr:CCA tRNA nucleotidyltransferase [Cyclobacteriaceae bacterium]